MKKTMPKSWNTKLGIFQAALRLLNVQEIDDITVRSIAKEAGIAVGSFYYYYKTKYDVYHDAYGFMDDYFENVVASSLPDGGAWAQLMYFFSQYNYYNTERTPFKLYKVVVTYASRNHQQNITYGYFRVLNKIVADGQDRGEITLRESSDEIALFLLNCMRGLYRHWVLMEGRFNVEEASRQIAHKVLSVYMTPPEGCVDYRIVEPVAEKGGQKRMYFYEDPKGMPPGADVRGTAASDQ